MKIYTKTGDGGETGLYGGARVAKDDARVATYGTVDELNAALGMSAASASAEQAKLLQELQADLFVLGAELACMPEKTDKLGLRLIDAADIERLEQTIDAAQATLPELQSFVLPGGSLAAAHLHLSRAVCRRAERELVALQRDVAVRPELVIYLNRLSDLLFVLARRANALAKVDDIPWKPR